MFKLKSGLKSERDILHTLKDKLESLKNKITQLKKLETGLNISQRSEAFDLILVTEFDTEEDLEIYRAHRDHQKVVSYLKEVIEDIVVVDYLK
jgi:hypothetical protein